MTDLDPLLDAFPHVQTSRFASIEWPNWPHLVYDPEFARDPVKVFKHALIYIIQCLEAEPVAEKLGPDTNVFIANWNPEFDEALFEEIVKGDRLMTAAFHSGAMHGIDKLREDMTQELEQDGLGECINALEVEMHQQFLKRIAGVMELAEVLELGGMMDEIEKMLKPESGEKEEDDNIAETEEDGSGSQTNGGETEIEESGKKEVVMENDFVESGEKPGRERKQAKSKKAKKAKKAKKTSKKGKETTFN